MSATPSTSIHELEFCAEVKSACDALFAAHPEWPFREARIEEYGVGNWRRSDLRVYTKDSDAPVLCGEVKLPGTPAGASPFHPALLEDAGSKADNLGCPFFFTWNVNHFVLFDRSLWRRPIIERRLRDWNLGLGLRRPEDCRRPDVLPAVRERFLPEFFEFFARIITEGRTDWGLPPDRVFINSLETFLEGPVASTADYLAETADRDAAFAGRLMAWMAGEMGWTFDREDPDDWRAALDRASRSLCYVFVNRAIFYEALRARYADGLEPLVIPRGERRSADELYAHFRARFQRAVSESGDYEPIFYPEVRDDLGALVFAAPAARDGWRELLANIEQYNFRNIPYDVIGGIFQRLIAPEERQKFGQFFTGEDIVDVINAFCIRRASDTVLDPACGSGSFLIRAYHRKAWLSERAGARPRAGDAHRRHQELLADLFGCDIALFAAHLATLNLAARDIRDEENYPRIARGNFFELAERPDAFCRVPSGLRGPDGRRASLAIPLPPLDAVVGNPPYIRQEAIARAGSLRRRAGESDAEWASRRKNTKEFFAELARRRWPDLRLSGRSDLHCYFWPVAAAFLKEGGMFGFLTSSSWLDVEYGFPLQRWILQNFRLIAIIESLDEPWFPDARVKTAITILQRCSDAAERERNIVRFVRLHRPLAEALGRRGAADEGARQRAAERLRDEILEAPGPRAGEALALRSNDRLRVVAVRQGALWREGVRAWSVLRGMPSAAPDEESEAAETKPRGDVVADAPNFPLTVGEPRPAWPDYAAGKWGRYIRAPDLYFRLLREHGERFVRLGEIAEIRFGIKSGCDAFFMPRDATEETLARARAGMRWLDIGLLTPCKLREVESGKVRIVRAGDGTLHAVETEFLRPEVHSLMQVDRPVVRAADCDRYVLWVGAPLEDIRHTYAARYIRWGERQTFLSKKSKAVPVPLRPTCAARERWYDLTDGEAGMAFWPMTQQYRHIIAANPDRLVCNHNLFLLRLRVEAEIEDFVLLAILNSTVVALFKHFYGRYAGTEGALKTEVCDVNLLEIPDPRRAGARVRARLQRAFGSLCARPVTHLVQESLLQCHNEELMRDILLRPPELADELRQADRRELDDAVFELIGVGDRRERQRLLDELYVETARYYRYQRTLEIQGMRNRARAARISRAVEDIAESLWESLDAERRGPPVADWIRQRWTERSRVGIPEGRPRARGRGDLFSPAAVVFRDGAVTVERTYASPEQAALVAELAELGLRGEVEVPAAAEDCRKCLDALQERLARANEFFRELADTRAGQEEARDRLVALLTRWFVHGRQRQPRAEETQGSDSDARRQ